MLAAAVGVSQEDIKSDEKMPMVLDNTMDRIGDEEYWVPKTAFCSLERVFLYRIFIPSLSL